MNHELTHACILILFVSLFGVIDYIQGCSCFIFLIPYSSSLSLSFISARDTEEKRDTMHNAEEKLKHASLFKSAKKHDLWPD